MFRALEASDDVEVTLETTQIVDWSVHALMSEQAWTRTRGAGIHVAVLDFGGTDHPDLTPNIERCVGPMDTNGHGTHVAGLIGACNNGFGVVGVAPECRLSLYNVLGDGGLDIPTAILQAVHDGADVISMSLGSDTDYPEVYGAVKTAHDMGVVLVAADGNDPSHISYPAAYDEVIGVSALDQNMAKASFAPMPSNHVALPGVNVISCWLGGQYARLSGTSQATPLMAGAVALMLSLYRPARNCAHALVASEMARVDRECGTSVLYCPRLDQL